MAEAGGWDRVTTRALAQAIEYSQPVLYGHFPGGKADIMNAVALQGFGELAERLAGLSRSRRGTGRIRAVATGYLDFAAQNPGVYQAMFTLEIPANFADGHPDPRLEAAFESMASVLDDGSEPGGIETRAELFWSALHGLATLERDGRLRAAAHRSRVEQLVRLFATT